MFQTFFGVLAARAQGDGDREAIVQGGRRMTFAEWHRGACALGDWYRTRGVGRGSRVILRMDASPDMAAAVLGLWKVGAIVTIMDPKAKGSHLTHAVRTIEPVAILCDDATALPTHDPAVPAWSFTDIDLQGVAASDASEALPTDAGLIVFTSGSTGRPKGVTHSHRTLLRACETVTGYLGISSADRILCGVPWSFIYGFGQMLSTLMRGATQVLPTTVNPFAICEAIAMHRPTVFAGVPALYTYLLRGVSPFRETDLSSIAILTNTGGRIPAPVLQELMEIFEGRKIFLNYGLTESYRTSYLDPALLRTHPTSIGRPIPGADVAIVREDGSLADVGEVGEIVLRGDYLCLGYWNDPETTARVLRPDPLAAAGCPSAAPALFTGDFGRIDADGLLYFVCRRDSQLKSMGVRVSPPEIEDILFDSGLVKEVAVVGRPHEMLGDEICAVVVPATGCAGDVVGRLTAHARETMSPYMMPRRILLRSALPKTTTGKIDYPALRAEVANI